MTLTSKHTKARRGFTLLELAIATAIIALVMGSILRVMSSAEDGYGQGATTARVQQSARRALRRIAAEFENVGQATLLPNPLNSACSDLVFQSATGVDEATSTPIYGNASRLRFVMDVGENENGLDDDGDGIIDEGRVVLTRDFLGAEELSVVVAHDVRSRFEGELANGLDDNGNGLVDERGFCMSLQDGLLVLRLSISGRSPEGTRTTSTVETSVHFRN